MFTLPGYKILETLLERQDVLVCRAWSEKLQRNVILKILRAEYPTLDQVAAYEAEFELLKEIQNEGVPRAFDLLPIDKMRVLVLEDIDGVSLAKEIGKGGLSLQEQIQYALKMTRALAAIQSHGIIHRDIKPENIVINRSSGRVQIADFGLAKKTEKLAPSDGLSGTLHYISPEQTGRTQNAVDYRTDFYSLGITLYEWFAGRLPFSGTDDMEWIHSHIAITETPLHELNTNIPVPLSLIVQKLMKKSPDERYQSALGILSDLEACLTMDFAGEFSPGRNDAASQFRLSPKLYGRDEEIKLVNKILAKVALGENRLAIVKGDPGAGKSSLVNVVKDGAKSSGGYFIFGKFDQFRKDIPFSALIQAFNQLVAQILTEDEAQIQAWKERIMSAMGENAAIITDLLPQIELIIGRPPVLPVLEAIEQQQRFQKTFLSFVQACCERGRPLIIFLDDLQWADSASRFLMQAFLTEVETESLFMIGAYRESEVNSSHPLSKLIEELKDKNVPRDEIHLSGLKVEHVSSLIQDSFPVSKSDPHGLAQLVFEKTNGNPFFVSQFLKTLYDKSLLRFETFGGWTWDLEKIKSEDVTSNVLELLTQKIKGLPDEAQELIQLASCFGSFFRVEELKSYNQKSDVENSILLQPAIREGLILRGQSGQYKFIHDRVQEAAYTLISPVMRANIHYRIAKELLAQWKPEKVRESIFYLVNHFNAGHDFLETTDEFTKGAELNLMAAQRAKESSVHDVALKYAVTGLQLLEAKSLGGLNHLSKPLMVIRATSEYSLQRHEESDRTLKALLASLTSNLEKAQVYRWMVEVAHVNDRNADAANMVITALKLLGLRISKKPSSIRVLGMLLRARRLFLQRLNSETPEGDKPSSEIEREIVALLASAYAPAYVTNKNMLAFVGLKAVLLSLEGRYLDLPPRGLLGVLLAQGLGDFRTTKKLVDSLIESVNQRDPLSYDSRGLFTLYAGAGHLVKPYREIIKPIDKALEILSMQGQYLYRMNLSLNLVCLHFMTERRLEKAFEKLTDYLGEFIRSGYGNASTMAAALMINDLRGIHDPQYSLEKIESILAGQKSPLPKSWCNVMRMYTWVILGDFEKAFNAIEEYDSALAQNPLTSLAIQSRLLSSLVRIKNLDKVSKFARFKHARKVKADIRLFKKMSAENPSVFTAPYLMLLGQWQSHQGKNLEAIKTLQESIKAAQNGEVVFHEPLANELLASVFAEQGLDKLAATCLREALFLYESWGAGEKVARLLKAYPELSTAVAARAGSSSRSRSTGTISAHNSKALDLNTVLKATNALNSEIEMTRLVRKMLNILIENAGAERAVLILNESQQLVVRGEVSVKSQDEFRLLNIKFEDFKNVPRAMVAYVARTNESMVLENALEDERLNRDAYVLANKVLSSVCLPIMSQGALRGVLYLENNAAKGVFSPERVELMTILSGQIAISLENADLYQKQGEAIRMQNELVTAHAVQEMLFPPSNYEQPGIHVSGYYQPATECGGDWWSYSTIGDWVYLYIGDATGHGAPAALVTSAACSAVSVIETRPDISPEKAMELLNAAVCRATKGQIHMTFLIGALNSKTGEFKYVRASHESPLLLRKKNLQAGVSMRAAMEPLMGENGSSLGVSVGEKYASDSIQLEPGDTVVFYTDGIPELTDKNGRTLGERGFLDAVHKSVLKSESAAQAVSVIGETVQKYKSERELLDDVTLCMIQFTGAASEQKNAA